MTHPIPGADSELPPLPKAKHQFDVYHDDGRVTFVPGYTAEEVEEIRRAAAKVGANVAAEQLDAVYSAAAKVFNVLDTARDGMTFESPRIAPRLLNLRLALVEVERSRLAAGAPAETPKPTGHKPPVPEADRIGPLGERLFLVGTLCNYGTACAIAAQPCPAPIAGDVEKDALLDFCAEHSLHVQTCYAEGSSVPVYEVSIVHGPIENDSLQCMGAGATLREAIDAARAAMLANSSSGEAG